ncbi:MAG: DUF1905 domain-containing protein [Bacteriovoracaceae bacterium]|nr:DUF1905 domain-containing protein [Bacteriovoracaceae bacterium]
MTPSKRKFIFSASVWLYSGKSSWYFITVPRKISQTIYKQYSSNAKAWGTVGVLATIRKTTWTTSLFPDKKSQCYFLPLKLQIRKKEKILAGEEIKIKIEMS